jgi:hypothetical protein
MAVFDLLRHAVLQHRLLAANLLQHQLAAFVVQFPKPFYRRRAPLRSNASTAMATILFMIT